MSELKQALENLKKFSQLLDKSSTSQNSILNLSYRIVGLFSSHDKDRLDLIDQVCLSSDIVKNYSPLINVLEEGDPEQQKFACDVKEIVDRFNSALDKINKAPTDWGSRIARFLYSQGGMFIGERLAKIELPARASAKINFPFPSITIPKSSNTRPVYLATLSLVKPSTQTLELYLMKVISLLVKSELLLNSEAREIVRATPYVISLDKEKEVLGISQVLEPLPGQTINVSGAFKRDSHSSLYTIFLPDACEFSTQSVQTGFPHPLQRHGFAFSEALMPLNLGSPENTSVFSELHAIKKKIALELLPKGALNAKARLLIRMKKQTFESDAAKFLKLHEQLTLAICGKGIIAPDKKDVIKKFFELAAGRPNGYEFISSVNNQIITQCITLPQKALLQSHSAVSFENCQAEFNPEAVMKNAFEGSLKNHNDKFKEKEVLAYIALICSVIFPPAKQIVLQNYSKISSSIPPTLGKFANAIEASLYHQLKDFHHELVMAPNQIDMSLRMQTLLEEEINRFS